MEDVKDIFAERLTEERTKLGLSTRALAEKAGVSAGFISAVETKRNNPTALNAMKIAKALNTSVEHLMGEDEYIGKMYKDSISPSHDLSAFERLVLCTYKFPNGMTYAEMDSKLKEMQELEKKLEKMASIFGDEK